MNKRRDPIMKMVNIRMTAKQAEELKRYAWDVNASVAAVIRNELERKKIISPTVEK
jgi:hypothetical protein